MIPSLFKGVFLGGIGRGDFFGGMGIIRKGYYLLQS